MEPETRQVVVALGPVVAIGVIGVGASVALGSSIAAFVLGAGAIVCAAIAAWRVIVIERAQMLATVQQQTPAQIATVRSDRRRPTFDRETGLLAEWYWRLRFEEEIARAKRYAHPLTALTVTASSPDAFDTARLAVRAYLREVDFAGDLAGVIAICLPNTSSEAAQNVVGRMAELVKGLEIAAREYPDDGSTVSELLNEHAWHTTREDAVEPFADGAAA